MTERLKRLIDERNQVVKEIRDTFDKADKDNKGILTTEQDSTITTLEARDDQLSNQIEKEERQVEREKSLKAIANGSEPVALHASNEPERSSKESEKRMKFFRAWLTEGAGAAHHPEFRDLSAGSLTQGGSFIAPQEFIATLLKAVDNNVWVRKYATVIPMSKSTSLGVPTLDTNPDDAEWTVELATGSADSGMTTGKRELTPWPIAKRIKLSNKLLQISAIPIEALVSDRFAYKFGVTQEKGYLTGHGASQALGVYTASSKGISTSRDVSTDNTTTAVTFDGLINAFYSLKEQYQAIAVWNFHRLTLKMLRKIKDGEGRYMWQPAVSAGMPATLMDRPIFMSEYAPSTYTTGLYVGVVGDWSKYWIAQVLDFQMQRLSELYAETNQVGWIGRMEVDGMPMIEEAFARVKLA